MADRCDIEVFQPVTLALTEALTKQSEIPARIPGMFDIVYTWLHDSNVVQTGHNFVLYDRFTADGMRMQVGFPVSKKFQDSKQVTCVELAGGRAAHTTVTGPYSGIRSAHTQLNAWCLQHKLTLSGMSWEVYGDWFEDQSRLVTDIYFRLR